MSALHRPPTLEQIIALPKALLHDHLDGGLRPQTIIDIAKEIGYDKLPTTDSLQLADWFEESCNSGSLVRYLETFDHTIAVMQRKEDLIRVARECVLDLARDGVVYAEVRGAPDGRAIRVKTLNGACPAGRNRDDGALQNSALKQRPDNRRGHV
ncbi:MAG: hypothetical protein EBW14_18475, partial [Oxalobacteraceae bacterium]|nr:hypothetical protein [Oxalobacteraceae bacterium]